MHGLAVYVKEGLPFARDLSLENSADCYLCFGLALLHSVFYFFFLHMEDISKLSASAAASEFCEWFQVGIDIYIYIT